MSHEIKHLTCKHCMYAAICLAAIKNERCNKFKYDPPDGGYYG